MHSPPTLKTPLQIPNPNELYCKLFLFLPPLPTCDCFSNLTANLIITAFRNTDEGFTKEYFVARQCADFFRRLARLRFKRIEGNDIVLFSTGGSAFYTIKQEAQAKGSPFFARVPVLLALAFCCLSKT